MNTELEPLAFSPADAAVLLGVSRETVRRMVLDGRCETVALPGVKRHLIPRREIERLLGGTASSSVPVVGSDGRRGLAPVVALTAPVSTPGGAPDIDTEQTTAPGSNPGAA